MKDEQSGRQQPQGKSCKVGGKSLAFVCMFSLNYVSPTSGREVEKKRKMPSLDNDLSLSVSSQMHVASNSHLG